MQRGNASNKRPKGALERKKPTKLRSPRSFDVLSMHGRLLKSTLPYI
jgi:hypothetical protein